MKKNLQFDPFFLFKSAFYQTIMGSFLNSPLEPKSEMKLVDLPDGDKITMEIVTPKKWQETDETVVMVHGLCGSHRSPSLIRITKKLSKKNIKVIRVNLKGCGSGKNLARGIYHCGKSDDILEALKVIKIENPHSPIILIGYSLGGNIVLKLAGELKEKGSLYLKEVIALGPPIDLKASVRLFELPEHKIYLKYFTRLLRKEIMVRKKKYPEFTHINLPKNITMTDYNNLVIVPFFGFKDAEEYYLKCSSMYFIPQIKVPVRVLVSEDDPIISSSSFNEISIPENMEVYLTKNGGHLGYLGSPKRGFYWLDHILMEWICKNEEYDGNTQP